MRFDARLVRDDDSNDPPADPVRNGDDRCPMCGSQISAGQGEANAGAGGDPSDLPADLAALADQLRDDADDLANRFPAGDRTKNPLATRQTAFGKRWIRWSAVAAVLMMFATWPSVAERLAVVDAPKGAAAGSKEPIGRLDRAKDRSLAVTEVSSVTKEAALQHDQGVEEVSIKTDLPDRSRRPPADEVEMLRIQVSGFEKVIERLQAEVAARDKSQADMVKLIRSLQEEVATLKRKGVVNKADTAAIDDKGQGDRETPASLSTK